MDLSEEPSKEKMECPNCGQIEFAFDERVNGIDMYKCSDCGTKASF